MASLSPLIQAVSEINLRHLQPLPSLEDAEADIKELLASFELQVVKRFFGQIYWENETREASFFDRLDSGLRLENVAAHSWHVADSTMIIAPHFQFLDVGKAVMLAVLHDKLELFIGDFDPVGSDGRGTFTHAFNTQKQEMKIKAEIAALSVYLSKLRKSIRKSQEEMLLDIILGRTLEAQFMKSIDKLQALAFVFKKKSGNMTDEHIAFSIRYSRKCVEYFPAMQLHYRVLLDKFLNAIADFRKIDRNRLDSDLFSQLELDLR